MSGARLIAVVATLLCERMRRRYRIRSLFGESRLRRSNRSLQRLNRLVLKKQAVGIVDGLAVDLQLPGPTNNPTLMRSDDQDKGGEEVFEWRKRSQAKVGQGM